MQILNNYLRTCVFIISGVFLLESREIFAIEADRSIDTVTLCVQNGQIKDLDALLSGGISPKGHGDIPSAPLYYAIMLNYPDCVYLLLKHGENPNTTWSENESPALAIAAQNRSSRCIDVLLQFGADSNKVDKRGFSPLYKAMISGDDVSASMLRKAGAKNLTKEEEQALHPK
jgi:ankyrin repeat protein